MSRPALHALAAQLGVLPEYTEMVTHQRRVTSDNTYVTLAAAMGYDAATEAAASRALRAIELQQRRQLIPPVRVVRGRAGDAFEVPIVLPYGATESVEWHVTLDEERGTRGRWEGQSTVDPDAHRAVARLPALPEPGYHDLSLELRADHSDWSASQRLIVAPHRCRTPAEVLAGLRTYGVCANLYTLASERNWGVGDTSDLADLCRWCGERGGAFVGLNPLHAVRNVEPDISPYGPISRLYRNPVYIDVMAVPELAHHGLAQETIRSTEWQRKLADFRSARYVPYGPISHAKLEVLSWLYPTFKERHGPGDTQRGRAFHAFLSRHGEALTRFATFMALAYHLGSVEEPLTNWRVWPEAYRRPDSEAVAEFARRHERDIDFHRYLQFLLDEQLGATAQTAQASGLKIGLYQDLAVGSSPDGSDVWAMRDLFAERVNVGAPPDDYSTTGQDWGLPPLNPHRLAADRYDYWIRLVQNALAHSGALRIDHAMGLTRQFWVPWNESALNGAYVSYPAEDLTAILALESHRHNALIIGEDLGTVPPGFSERLERWGILSCRVLYFQRDEAGDFLPPDRYCDRALVTTTTHDHVPLAGFWQGTDIPLRRQLGLLTGDGAVDAARRQRRDELHRLLERLAAEGLIDRTNGDISYDQFCAAVHAFLARTPSPLIGVMLDDLAGETEPVNFPGVGTDRHLNWSRKMARPLAVLLSDARVMERLNQLPGTRGEG